MKHFFAAFAIFVAAHPAFAGAPKSPPNIVLIISDDQGAADYGFLGHPHIKTPHLDRLAAQSLVFPRGYVTSSVCCPSLASIITGTYPHQNKITSNDPPPKTKGRAWYGEQMSTLPTLVRLLQRLGYLSFQAGKWWHGEYSTGGFTNGMTTGDPKKGGRHGDVGLDIGRKTMKPVFDFIDDAKAKGKPFVVWYAPMLPHLPHDAGEKYLAPYRDKAPSPHVAKYWANVTRFDDTCGQLLAHLDKTGLADNTIVVYICDNGWIQDVATGQKIRSKLTQYEAGHRTPIMVRWPGKVTPALDQTRVSSLDLVPTLLKAVGAPVPPEMPGLDLLDAAALKKRTALFGECFTHDAVEQTNPAANLRWRWIIDGDWRLIVPNPKTEPKAVVELYNLAADPEERTNLAATQPDRVRQLREELDRWWTPGK